jgi:quinol monooxygenase YgiN
MDSAQRVRRFEREGSDNADHGIVDELMSEYFVHRLPCRGYRRGAGMRAVGEFVTAAIHDSHVQIPLILTEGDLVADRIEAAGIRADPGASLTWGAPHLLHYRRPDHRAVARPGVPSSASRRAVEKTKEDLVPIYQTAHYQVNPGAVEKVKAAIVEFVEYVTEHEPGTRIYTAWQQESDPTKFVHLFEFADEAAHQAHGASAAVRKFEEVYQPELAARPVVFTDYLQIASNQSR